MGGFAGAARTMRWGAEDINVQRPLPTFNVQCRTVAAVSDRRMVARHSIGGPRPPPQSKLRPHRRVIGRLLALAHLAFDSRGAATFRERSVREDRIDPQPPIFGKRQHPIIPPTETAG